MLKRVWSYTVDFCIRFRTIPDNPTHSPISREISIEHSTVGLAMLAQLGGGGGLASLNRLFATLAKPTTSLRINTSLVSSGKTLYRAAPLETKF